MSEMRASTENHGELGLGEIRLKGHLDDRWAAWFDGMTITLQEDGNTLLTGPVIDQAALHGLLKKVRDIGAPLLSVNCLKPGPSTTLGTGQADASDAKPSSSIQGNSSKSFKKGEGKMKELQKMGGIAALIYAATFVVSIVLGVTIFFPLLNSDTGQYLAFAADNQALLYMWNLVAYWVSSVAGVVLMLALYERLKAGSPVLVKMATVFGFIWVALCIGSGNLMLNDIRVIADLYGKDPTQAAMVWLALQAVENGLVSGNEIVGSLWVLLLSLAALRTGGLARALNYLGVALGVVGLFTGILAFIPAIRDFIVTFGLGITVWSMWVGIVMLRSRPQPVV